MEMQKIRSDTQVKPTVSPKEELRLKECTICKGELVMDASGAAIFCDECWTLKCLAAPGD
jgi:hypothetical protein